MATEKQLQANKRNAQRSTGPRSPKGKTRSRVNSWKHGLTLIIVGEHSDDFDQLRSALMEEHDPQSALESELVARLAGTLWRLRRVPFFEAAIMDVSHWRVSRVHGASSAEEKDEVTDWEASVHFGRTLMDHAMRDDALGKLARHETMLMNAFTKTLQTLLLLQDKRNNSESQPVIVEAVALPPAA